MIDLHGHFLPGIDDGADTLPAALEMLKMAEADGTTRLVITPHIQPGTYDNTPAIIAEAFATLEREARTEGVGLELAWAAEMHIVPELMEQAEADTIPWLGEYQGRKVVLLEMPHSHVPPGCVQLIRWLVARDILPLIAHPERNLEIIERPEHIRPLAGAGAHFQLTGGALTGVFGEGARNCARLLLDWGLGDALASDAHSTRRRNPKMSDSVAELAALVGDERAADMTEHWPREVSDWHFRGAA
ncbi:MAG: tyrosine-protein phosphatase [Pseudomonadota bacterium]